MTDYRKTPLPQQTHGTRRKNIPELPLLSDSIALIAGVISWDTSNLRVSYCPDLEILHMKVGRHCLLIVIFSEVIINSRK